MDTLKYKITLLNQGTDTRPTYEAVVYGEYDDASFPQAKGVARNALSIQEVYSKVFTELKMVSLQNEFKIVGIEEIPNA